MQTSYFAKYKKIENAVSIALSSPKGFKGKEYKKLAPPSWLLKKYKNDNDKDFYIKAYYDEVLNNLDPDKVYKELGKDAVLLCWEKSGKFCHRYLVSEWLSHNLKICITEYSDEIDIFS